MANMSDKPPKTRPKGDECTRRQSIKIATAKPHGKDWKKGEEGIRSKDIHKDHATS